MVNSGAFLKEVKASVDNRGDQAQSKRLERLAVEADGRRSGGDDMGGAKIS